MLSRDPRRPVNRLFFALTVMLALWGVGDTISLMGQTTAVVLFGRKVAATGWFLIGPVTAHFTMALTRSKRLLSKRWLIAGLYGIFACLLVLTWTTNLTFKAVVTTPQGFHLVGGPLRLAIQTATILLVLASSIALLVSGFRKKDRIERERMLLMGFAILLPVVGTVVTEVMVPYEGIRPTVSGLDLTMIMAAIMAYAVSRMGLLSDLLTSMGRAVLPVMKDPVFILNPTGLIETSNPAAADFTGYSEEETRGLSLEKLFPGEAQYEKVAPRIAAGDGFGMNLEIVLKDGGAVPVAVDFVPIKSRSSGVMGFVVIMHDMSAALDLVRVQERARMATREAEMQKEYTRELKDIIDVAGHELRHPASVFKGYTSTLISSWDRLDRDTVDDFLQALDLASDRLTRLTVDLLDVSRVESEEIDLVYSDVLPPALVASAIMEVGTRGYGHEFEILGTGEDRTVLVDAEKIESVLAVLLDNAAKFSPDYSVVEAGFRMDAEEVVFYVSDRGWISMEARAGGGSVFSFGVPFHPQRK